MNINRRRFLTISAALGLGGISANHYANAKPIEWHGHLMGAQASITINGDKAKAEAAIGEALGVIQRLEKSFSIYDQNSELSQLNKKTRIQTSQDFQTLLDYADITHRLSEGLFDPTIQPIFTGLQNPNIGWQNVALNSREISFLKPRMAMTLNGIAQGYITDRVSEVLIRHGLENILVNMGEYRAGKSPQQLGVANSANEIIHEITLSENAVATSSNDGYQLQNAQSHIIAPDLSRDPKHWRTVSVVAKNATMADGFSTALSLTTNTDLAQRLIKAQHVEQVIFEDYLGKIITI